MTSRDKMSPIFRPDHTVARADMCLAVVPRPSVFAPPVFTTDSDRVVHIQNPQTSRTPSDVPQLDRSLRATAGQYVFVMRAPCHREYRAVMTGERVRTGA